jgi:hypothetical protein
MRMTTSMTTTRTTVNKPSPLLFPSSFLHGAVGLIDDHDEDENDETLYQVSQRWGDSRDEELIDQRWAAMLKRAHKRAEAERTPVAGQNEILYDEVLPQQSLLFPHDGDKPMWRLRCHVSLL